MLTATAALLAAVVVLALVLAPPRHLVLQSTATDGTVAGSLHVHTIRSDGRSTPDVVAAAAARAGLRFIVFTDHGDGTRVPDPPTYRSGVLCIDAVEISTNDGHYLALDMSPAPYPLGGDGRTVIQDVSRLGGFGIVAHPDSPKPELEWRDWDAAFDGMELVNPDSAWRRYAQAPGVGSRLRLAEALLTYPWRPPETIAALLDEGRQTTGRWRELTSHRRVIGLAGADAHAVLGWRDVDPSGAVSVPLPSYEASFRALSIHVVPDRPLTGDPRADAEAVMRGLRRGHAYVAIDGFATPPSFEFTATSSGGAGVEGGDGLPPDSVVTLRVRSNAPPSFTTTIWSGDHAIATAQSNEVIARAESAPNTYRVDIRSDRPGTAPWILSNPIYVGLASQSLAPEPPVTTAVALFDERGGADRWRIEADPASRGTVRTTSTSGGQQLVFEYALTPAKSDAPVALVAGVPDGVPPFDCVTIRGSASRPTRVSVQLRSGEPGQADELWMESAYFDQSTREQRLNVADMRPRRGQAAARADAHKIRSVLLVVDRTNNLPGSSGSLTLERVALAKAAR